MKYLVCYKENEVKSYHKTARITSPLIWKKSQSADILKKFVKSYNASMKDVNILDAKELHLAILESGEYVALPTDVPIARCVTVGTKIYVRHGAPPSSKTNQPARLPNTGDVTKSIQVCARYGCMTVFDGKEHFGPCLYHKAPPVFLHDTMYWACCPDQVVNDFGALIKVRGCQTTKNCTLDDQQFLREMSEGRVSEAVLAENANEEVVKVEEIPTTAAATELNVIVEDVSSDEQNEDSDDGDDKKKEVEHDGLAEPEDAAHDEHESEEKPKEEESTDTPEPGSGIHTLVQFRKVLHSFGVEDSTYENFVAEVRKEDPVCAELKDEELVQNDVFKQMVGKLLEDSLKVQTTGDVATAAADPTQEDDDDHAGTTDEEWEVLSDNEEDEEEDYLEIDITKTEPEVEQVETTDSDTLTETETPPPTSPTLKARKFIMDAYSHLTSNLSKHLEQLQDPHFLDKCCAPMKIPLTAE